MNSSIQETRDDPRLERDIARFIQDETAGSFESLILRLFARQYGLNSSYRILCDNLGLNPENVRTWTDIPAVPARAFKISILTSTSLDNIVRVFHSSGTTEGQPGKHYLDQAAIDLYRISLQQGFQRIVPAGLPILALMPPLATAVNSSLSFMLDALSADRFFWGDTAALAESLTHKVQTGLPICLFGTAFALLELFDERSERWRLPHGSVVIETGGFKGRTRQVSREELYALIDERLAVKPPKALAEYGMSEMASQYYGSPGDGLAAPHWLRARIIDPISELDAEEGLLCHYDVANWNSAAVIQTQDMARKLPSGRFELLGRAPKADLRGCSLTVEDRWLSTAQSS